MENVTHALFLAFAMFVLALGLSYGIYLIGSMSSAADTLIQSTDATSNYQTVSYDSSDKTKSYTRIVGVDTVISTLYRYYKENFSVEIYTNPANPKLHQIFDLTIENKLAGNAIQDPEWRAYNNLYNTQKSGKQPELCDLFNAPWIVNQEYTKQRVDMYIAGQKAYINGVLVDYEKKGLLDLIESGSNTFEEQFIQYTYEGQTISDNFGEDVETITGNVRAQNKIIIRYIQQ
ncbi:MAG: hypothetical protein J6J60_04855 [Clostridia bacterium]|nr:hypothetical protein [Clostridia bacterium]